MALPLHSSERSSGQVLGDEPADAELLGRFLAHGDEAAFAAIVRRHHALVLGVCRRRLRCLQDAEDAFQATFLVLAQRGHRIRRPGALASWLYGVAYRVSLRQSRLRARSSAVPLEVPVMVHDDPLVALAERHEQLVTDEEISALPDRLRAPLVLRYLAGKSNEEVAAELAISVAAVEGRLKRAKARLRRTLSQRGIALGAALAALGATSAAEALAAEPLIAKTIGVCLGGSAAVPASGAVDSAGASAAPTSTASQTAVQLATKEVLSMTTFKLSTFAAVAAIVVGTSTLGWGLKQALSQTADDNPFSGPSAGVTLNQQEGTAETADPSDPFPAQPGTVDGVRGVGPAVPAGDATTTAQAAPPQTVEDSSYDVVPRSESERKIRAALQEPTSLDLFDVPLEEAVDTIERLHNFPIELDEKALLDIGVDTSSPVKANYHGMSLRSALRLMLRDLELTYIIEDEYMLITTEEEQEVRLSTRIYPIRPQWNVQTAELIDAITYAIKSDTWDHAGGPGTIKPLGNNLIISQSYHVHEEIKSLLRQLDRAAQMQPQQAGFGQRARGTYGSRASGGYGAGYDSGSVDAEYGGSYGAGGIGPPSSAGSGYGSGATGIGPQGGRLGTPPVIRGGASTDEGPADGGPSRGE
jgi:RNA polymerase sigma factor (sigma-70 family)